jgi:MFS family permease
LLSVIPGLLAALAILAAIRTIPRPAVRQHQPIRLRVRPVLHGQLGRLLLGVSAFEFGNAAATLLILRATDLLTPEHGHSSAVKIAIGLYAGYNLAATLASVPGGTLGDRRGNSLVLFLGELAFGTAYVGLGFVGSSIFVLVLLFALAGVAIGFVETAEHSAVASLVPTDLRGSAFGLLAAVQSFGNLAASAVAGALWTLISPRVAFLYLAGWMAFSLAALALARRPTGADSM